MGLLHLHIGGAGVRMAASLWAYLASEHHLSLSGLPLSDTAPSHSYFYETAPGHYKARAILIDLKPDTVDSMREYTFFQAKITGLEAGSLQPRGELGGKEVVEDVLEAINGAVRLYSDVNGFLIYCSLLGGTGSGFTKLLTDRLQASYNEIPCILLALFPSHLTNDVTSPYNFTLSSFMFEHMSLIIAINNDALYAAANTNSPDYYEVNEVVAQMVAMLHSPVTHESWNQMNIHQICTALVKFTRINIVIPSIVSVRKGTEERFPLISPCGVSPSVTFQSASILNTTDIVTSWDIEDQLPSENTAFDVVRRSSPGWKSWEPASCRELTLSNSTAIVPWLNITMRKFDTLYSRRSYVHWYLSEGSDSALFRETRECLFRLQQDYLSLIA